MVYMMTEKANMKAYAVVFFEAGESFVLGVFSTAEKAAACVGGASNRYAVPFTMDEALDPDAACENDVNAQFA